MRFSAALRQKYTFRGTGILEALLKLQVGNLKKMEDANPYSQVSVHSLFCFVTRTDLKRYPNSVQLQLHSRDKCCTSVEKACTYTMPQRTSKFCRLLVIQQYSFCLGKEMQLPVLWVNRCVREVGALAVKYNLHKVIVNAGFRTPSCYQPGIVKTKFGTHINQPYLVQCYSQNGLCLLKYRIFHTIVEKGEPVCVRLLPLDNNQFWHSLWPTVFSLSGHSIRQFSF